KRFPWAELIIAGEGPERPKLEQLIAKNNLESKVKLVGSVSHHRLAHLFQSSQVAVFPFTQAEGLGLVLIEAMGCGCPVIASRVSGATDAIKDNETGIFIQPNSAESIKLAVSSLLEDPALCDLLSKKAHQFAFDTYNWSHCANRYSSVIKDAINSTKIREDIN
ncbi:MAG: glycosyltransferase family 4 protein, partial [Acidiferrobacterales bacterium]|nr:glycosyltransferase family 4 protein [Acidiferrobacterales bacterium]